MVHLVLFGLFILALTQAVQAGIFQDKNDRIESKVHALKYIHDIYPGKIVVTNPQETEVLDYASAVPIGRPGEKTTGTILSCAHTFIQSHGYDCKLSYHDTNGKIYDIERTIIRSNDISSIPEASQDIALYHIKKPTPCNSLAEIERNPFSTHQLSTLSYGWDLSFTHPQGMLHNLKGKKAYHIQGTFSYSSFGTYDCELIADRIISLFDGKTFDMSFLAKPNGKTAPHQTYYHDSGSVWFPDHKPDHQDYMFTALSSRFTPVIVDTPEEAEKLIDSTISEHTFTLHKTSFTLSVLKLRIEKYFKTTLTALSPHRDWIYQNLA